MIPRWGLVDPTLSSADTAERPFVAGPSPWVVRATLITTFAVLATAALLHLIRYVLLMVNRSTLLHPLIAGAVTWLGVLASVGAFVSVIGCAVVLTRWLIARRAAAYHHRGQPDPRPRWALRGGCLIPLLNLVWAPVFVLELAVAEERPSQLRRPIVAWWVIFMASTAMSLFATATAFTDSAQAIANNTVSFIVAYLLAAAAVAAAGQVVLAFERTPVERPAHRWLVLPVELSDERAEASPADESDGESALGVEPERQDPAA